MNSLFDWYSARVLQHCADSLIAKAWDNTPGLFSSWANVQVQKAGFGKTVAIQSMLSIGSIQNFQYLLKDLVLYNCLQWHVLKCEGGFLLAVSLWHCQDNCYIT